MYAQGDYIRRRSHTVTLTTTSLPPSYPLKNGSQNSVHRTDDSYNSRRNCHDSTVHIRETQTVQQGELLL